MKNLKILFYLPLKSRKNYYFLNKMDDWPKAAGLTRNDLKHENSVHKMEQNQNFYEVFKGTSSHTLDGENSIEADVPVEKYRKSYENYSCLCVFINTKLEPNGILKPLFNSLVAFPAYVLSLLLLLFCLAIAAIILLACLIVRFQIVNKSYFAPCSYNSDCDSTLGLQCSASDKTCNCPAVITKGHCDCSSGYYWNGTKCNVALQYLATGCSADYMCDQTKYLVCKNTICTCNTSKIYDSSTQTCRYNYVGCYNDPNTYNVNWQIYSPYSSGQMFYFVDICISTCRNLDKIYSSVFSWGNNRCYCQDSINTSVKATCELNCIGKNNEVYSCGSSSSWIYRSYYIN